MTSIVEMNSFDSAETDDEIVNIMRNPNASQEGSKIASPFQRWTTPRIANRKVLAPQDASASTTAVADIESASAAPSAVAPSTAFSQFTFTIEDLSMTQFEKADSEFFAEFNTGNNVVSNDKNKAPASQATQQEQVVVKQPSKDENSLDLDDCRSLDINDINDIVNASRHHHQDSSDRYHRDNDNPSDSLHSEVSSYMEECSSAVKSLNSSPHSVMEWDNSTFASSKMSKPRSPKKSVGKNLNTSSFSEAGESRTTRDTFDDETSSFVSSKVSYSLDNKIRVRVRKISDDSSSKQSSVVENIVYSAPLARLHEFITGNGLCCTTKGQPIELGDACSEYERKSPRKKKYNRDDDDDDFTCLDDEDDATYDDRTYDDRTDDTTSYHRRGGSAFSIESSAYYTTDDDETMSRSTRCSNPYTPGPPQLPRASPLGNRGTSRGRSPTIRSGYNSDRSLSRCASTTSSFNSDEKRVQGTALKGCESKDQTVESNESSQFSAEASAAAESVLSQDQALWMEMTAPSPELSSDSMQTEKSNSTNESKSPIKSNFLQNLQSRTASARVTPTKAKESTADIESMLPQTSPETDGYFKKLLSVGIQLQINDHPAPNGSQCQKRMGKLLICFNGSTEGQFESPFFIWKDMNNQSSTFSAPNETNKVESILLSDIKTIRKPREAELEGYPFVTPKHCFVLALLNGVTLFLEAVDAIQMGRVTAGLNGILNKLEQDINTTGDFSWIMKSLEHVKKKASDVQPHVVKKNAAVKKSLLQEAAARRKMRRKQQR